MKREKHIDINETEIITDSKGKPFLRSSDVFFNISHTDGVAACIIDDVVNGIDCELVREASDKVMQRCFINSEIDFVNRSADRNSSFTMLWTLKECYSKLTGQGVSSDLKQIAFDIANKKALFDCKVDFYSCLINNCCFVSWSEKGSGALHVNSCEVKTNDSEVLYCRIGSDYNKNFANFKK